MAYWSKRGNTRRKLQGFVFQTDQCLGFQFDNFSESLFLFLSGQNELQISMAKLRGVHIEESQEWNEQLRILKQSLNQRLFVIRCIMRQIPKKKLMSIVQVSKLRYGIQLCTKVRTNEAADFLGREPRQWSCSQCYKTFFGGNLENRDFPLS